MAEPRQKPQKPQLPVRQLLILCMFIDGTVDVMILMLTLVQQYVALQSPVCSRLSIHPLSCSDTASHLRSELSLNDSGICQQLS